MVGGSAQVEFAQFTSKATAAVAVVELGFIPAFARIYIDVDGTNSNVLEWANITDFTQWPVAAHVLITTGSTGVRTKSTSGPTAYEGNDTVTSTDVTNEKYHDRDGSIRAAGAVTKAGISIPAALQVNGGKNFIEAYRASK